MKKVLDFGKIDFNGSGRKNCRVTIEVNLNQKEKGTCLSICGNIWNPRETDIYCGGQIYNTLKELSHKINNNTKMKRIIEVWERYHLNDMKAGTPAQEKLVEEYTKKNGYEYYKVIEYLKQNDLYIDNGYKYGSAWLFEEIPAEIIAEITTW